MTNTIVGDGSMVEVKKYSVTNDRIKSVIVSDSDSYIYVDIQSSIN